MFFKMQRSSRNSSPPSPTTTASISKRPSRDLKLGHVPSPSSSKYYGSQSSLCYNSSSMVWSETGLSVNSTRQTNSQSPSHLETTEFVSPRTNAASESSLSYDADRSCCSPTSDTSSEGGGDDASLLSTDEPILEVKAVQLDVVGIVTIIEEVDFLAIVDVVDTPHPETQSPIQQTPSQLFSIAAVLSSEDTDSLSSTTGSRSTETFDASSPHTLPSSSEKQASTQGNYSGREKKSDRSEAGSVRASGSDSSYNGNPWDPSRQGWCKADLSSEYEHF